MNALNVLRLTYTFYSLNSLTHCGMTNWMLHAAARITYLRLLKSVNKHQTGAWDSVVCLCANQLG
jgi:hypothetical protein